MFILTLNLWANREYRSNIEWNIGHYVPYTIMYMNHFFVKKEKEEKDSID